MRSFLTRLAGIVALALIGLGLLAATPGVARAASGHSHCEEQAVREAAPSAPTAAPPTTLHAADTPCGRCPDGSCVAHLPCLSGPVIALAAPRLGTASMSRPSAPASVAGAPLFRSFGQSPPTPPPNAFLVR